MKKLEYMTEPELRELCSYLAHHIEEGCLLMGVEKLHFTLLLFNDTGLCQYVPPGDRTLDDWRDSCGFHKLQESNKESGHE